MALTSKPVWAEGLLIRPQHFQQHDRWIEHLLDARITGLRAYGWGIRSAVLNPELLKLGRIGLGMLQVVLPDGTVLDAPAHAALPEPRLVPQGAKAMLVKLAVPLRPGDGADLSDENTQRRFRRFEQPVRDSSTPERPTVPLTVARLSARLLFEGESEENLVTMPIARVLDIDPVAGIQLDPAYIPPCLDAAASPRLQSIVNDIRGLLRSRSEALAGEAGRPATESASLVDLLVLTIVNGRLAVFDHFASTPGLHPEILFRAIVGLAGELSTFTSARRRSAEFPAYRHDDLDAALAPIVEQLRQMLAVVIERNAVSLPLQERGYGIRTATITDRTIFQDCQFVLVAVASMPAETLRQQLPASMKIGSVEQIRDLVNVQLPGIGLAALPVAPRDIPFVQNAVYFELDQTVPLWRNLVRSAAFAFHVSGEYPGLHLEFWAIRGKRV